MGLCCRENKKKEEFKNRNCHVNYVKPFSYFSGHFQLTYMEDFFAQKSFPWNIRIFRKFHITLYPTLYKAGLCISKNSAIWFFFPARAVNSLMARYQKPLLKFGAIKHRKTNKTWNQIPAFLAVISSPTQTVKIYFQVLIPSCISLWYISICRQRLQLSKKKRIQRIHNILAYSQH